MADATQAELLARAKAILAKAREQATRSSPLADMAEWVRTGAPPSASVLRAAGYAHGLADPERLREINLTRLPFIHAWGFSIPCAEVVEALRGLRPLVELGAGTGYWSALLSAAGLDIIATDALPAGERAYNFTVGRHHPVEPMTAVAAIEAFPERDVFCSWPSEKDPWSAEAASRLQIGRCMALIGEPPDGVTGCAELYEVLDARFELIHAADIPQFPLLRDRFTVHRRVR